MIRSMLSETGEEHGLLREIANSSRDNDFKNYTSENKEKLKKRKKEESKLVKARYKNNQEKKHGKLEKPYCRYAGEPIQLWKFLSGYVYEVPLGLVEEVNRDCKMKKRSQSVDELTGTVTDKDRDSDQIHEFIPVGF